MDGVTCAIFLSRIAVVAEIVTEISAMHMWQKGSSSKRVLLILRRDIF